MLRLFQWPLALALTFVGAPTVQDHSVDPSQIAIFAPLLTELPQVA